MSEDEGRSKMSDITERLDVTPDYAQKYRKRLIDAGSSCRPDAGSCGSTSRFCRITCSGNTSTTSGLRREPVLRPEHPSQQSIICDIRSGAARASRQLCSLATIHGAI